MLIMYKNWWICKLLVHFYTCSTEILEYVSVQDNLSRYKWIKGRFKSRQTSTRTHTHTHTHTHTQNSTTEKLKIWKSRFLFSEMTESAFEMFSGHKCPIFRLRVKDKKRVVIPVPKHHAMNVNRNVETRLYVFLASARKWHEDLFRVPASIHAEKSMVRIHTMEGRAGLDWWRREKCLSGIEQRSYRP
jgi:hypothetical protein